MKNRILYIILGLMLLSNVGLGQTISFVPTGATTFCYGNSTTKLRISTSVTKWFQLQVAPFGTTSWTNLGAPTQVFAGTPQDVNPYYSTSQSYQIIYSSSFSMSSPTTVNIIIDLNVNPLPNATVAVPSTICNGASVSIGATAVTGNTYSWSSNVGTYSSTNSNPSVSPSSTQTYTLTETITATGCSNSNGVTITVNPRPTATLTLSPSPIGKNPICFGEDVSLRLDVVSSGTWSLTLSDNSVASGVASRTDFIPLKPNSNTTYSISALSDANCTSISSDLTGSITVNVDALSVGGTIAGSTTVCTGTNSATLTLSGNTGSVTKWQSSTDAGFTTPEDIVNTTSSYSPSNLTSKLFYRAVVKNGVCAAINSSNADISVDALSVGGTIAGSTTVCTGTNSATLTLSGNTGSVTKWQSSTDAAFTTPVDIVNTTSSYSPSNLTSKLFYRAVVRNGVCASTNSSNADISINPLPAKPTLTNQTICEGATATITGPTGTYTYTWQVPTGVATSTTKTVSTTKAGTYSLTITDANSCTSEVGTASVTLNALPPKPTLTSPIICEGETASITMLTPTGTNSYTYTWTVPTGVATSTTSTLNTTKAGTYSLTITDANSCSSDVGTGVVTVNALPTLTITNPSAVCAPGTVDLTASTITAGSTASLTYTYFTNATATSTLTNTTLIGSSGTYYIKGTTASNCSAVNPVIISINPVPTFNVISPSVCVGSPLKVAINPLTGVTTDYDYTWTVPAGVTNPGNVSNFTTTIAGVYTATIKNKTTNCTSAPVNNTVSFFALPTAAKIVAADNKVIVNNTLNLTASVSGGSSPYNISWTPNTTIYYTISGQENAVFTALKDGKVRFKYQVKDANSCEVSSDEYEITIDPADIILVLPNAFTPNGDNNNDEFKVAASNTLGKNAFKSLEIYNRNGKLMFRTEDITRGWNGRYDNVLQDMGVYFVKLVKLNKDGQLVVETSPIYLLK